MMSMTHRGEGNEERIAQVHETMNTRACDSGSSEAFMVASRVVVESDKYAMQIFVKAVGLQLDTRVTVGLPGLLIVLGKDLKHCFSHFSMANEEDDPIIQEIDVYLAKSLSEKLYMFQYPIRPASMTYDDVTHLSAKIKPKQQKKVEKRKDRKGGGNMAFVDVFGTLDGWSVMNGYFGWQVTVTSGAWTLIHIQVRFSRPETEQARQRRVQSYEFLQKRQAEEHWVHLHYYGLRDSRSEHERQYLLSQGHGMAENTELIKSPSEYLMMLMPPNVEEEKDKPVAPSNVLSMAQLRTLPLADQIKILMKNVKVMPFANLMSLLGSGIDSTAVLRCIQQVAMLVQGNWVVKSDVLYPKDTSSPHSGVPAEVLCRGRDFVMWKFTQDRWVVRKEVATVTKLCPEDVKDFLEHMSIARINKGWEFLLPYDEDFVKKHPDVVQRQNMLWMGIQAKLEKVYNLLKEHLTPKKQDGQSAHPLLVSGEQRVNMAKAKVKQNCGLLEKELQKKKAESKANDSPSKMDISNVCIKEEPLSDEEPMDASTYESMNNGMVNGIHSEENSMDSLNGHLPGGCMDRVAQELKAFVMKTFKKQFVLTLSELKRLFNLHLASLPPGHTLFSGISDKMLQDMVLDTGCRQILVPIHAVSPDELKVYALWEAGDIYDQHRQVLLKIFTKNYRVRRNVIQHQLSQECGEDLNKQDVDRVIKVLSAFGYVYTTARVNAEIDPPAVNLAGLVKTNQINSR
ncbi:DNA-directed RNA polymerase III subunit RPC5 [Chelonia mydas]|uniref:DNA-directed RNA polymerase III subunit RPC5 n=1 Tax=Chelonia mydas TaxID=8469 RepID=M7BAK4_CHEMY|nr:DNA-directed RNA polymerase III subunit RPC5 [Chelonia mydas]